MIADRVAWFWRKENGKKTGRDFSTGLQGPDDLSKTPNYIVGRRDATWETKISPREKRREKKKKKTEREKGKRKKNIAD